MDDCLFCKIIAGEIPSKKIYEDEKCYAFYDISPQAPVHFLVIPKTHIKDANALNAENADVVAHAYVKIAEIAKTLGIAEDGYRIVNNCGKNGQQSVAHLHFHVLGGRMMKWPPG
ncbi:MAG: histidine triad nucleotide-binding protein [Clostridia bacterium]|nr:histidine triad nucleotide-binding protein [Clostridia bacterium]